jgi:hypothetical protein
MQAVSLCDYAKVRHESTMKWRTLWTILVFILGVAILLFLVAAIVLFISAGWLQSAIAALGSIVSGGGTAFLERQRRIAVEEEEAAYQEVVKQCGGAAMGDEVRKRFGILPSA